MQPQLPGLIPTATMALTVYLMPDGRVSHYEIEGRGPERSLTHFRAQASLSRFATDAAWVETVAIFTEWTAAAIYQLEEADRLWRTLVQEPGREDKNQDPPEDPSESA